MEKKCSGFLYRPPAAKFSGKRPVLVVIHVDRRANHSLCFWPGNYYLNELGIALIYPNVRGSTGYGKTFSLLDNGFQREERTRTSIRFSIGSARNRISTRAASALPAAVTADT